jgi:Protein of unknown function (DUF4058)
MELSRVQTQHKLPAFPTEIAMPNPFPGMNPYLEHPDFWPEVHHLLISAIKEWLTPQLRPKYRVAIKKRIYEIKGENSLLVAIPDLSIQQKRGSASSDCRILVSRSNQRPIADLYLFNIPDRIPAFSLPLRPEDVEPVLDLQVLINQLYDRAGYDFEIDYTVEPLPPLSQANAIWADALLRERNLRES